MNFNWLLSFTIFAYFSIEPSLSSCVKSSFDNCNYTVTCIADLARVKSPTICGSDHHVTFIITESVQTVLSKTFFSLTNFDTGVRSILASNNTWTVIEFSAFAYFRNCIQMDLSNNQISNIENEAFKNLESLKFLNLSRNSIENLMPLSFSIQTNYIQVLDLSYNKLTTVNTELNLPYLNKLYLQNNRLNAISDDSFKNLTELNHLYLQHNRLTTLNLALANLKKLITLDLSDNPLIKLEYEINTLGSLSHVNYLYLNNDNVSGDIMERMFSGLRNVTELELTQQNITATRNKTFAGMKGLLRLNLSRNSIRTIEHSSFVSTSISMLDLSYNYIQDLSFLKKCLKHLTEFIISNNNIQIITEKTFEDQTHIVNLDLSMNNIIRIEEKSLPLLKLQFLNIAGNKLNSAIGKNKLTPAKYLRLLDLSNLNITRIDDIAFVDLPVLARLNLSHNQIEAIETRIFKGANNIYSLDVSHNKLTNLKITNSTLTSLRALYINNNMLTNISGVFPTNFSLLYLDVSNNNIKMLYDIGFETLPNLTTLNLAQNNIQNFNNPKMNTLSSLIDLRISSNELTTINLSYFKDLTSVDLSNNNLTYINSTFLHNVENLQSLDMSRNRITVLPPGTFHNMKNLKYLNLSTNFLTKLRYGSLKGLHKTEVLDLSKNNITSLDVELFHECNELNTLIIDYNQIQSLDIDRLSLFTVPKLRTLSLGGNPISCREILLSIKSANTIVSKRRIEVSSIDKIYHEDNVHGIKCGDDENRGTISNPEAKSDKSLIISDKSLTVTIIWCSVLTILCISIVIYKKCHKTRSIDRSFPIDDISRTALELE